MRKFLCFLSSENVLFPLSFPNKIFSGYGILHYFFSNAWKMLCHFLPSSMVSDENFCQIIFLWQGVFSLFIFQYFSFSFRSLTVMCLCVDFFSFILFGVHSSSQICRISSSAKFGKFIHNFFEYFFQLCPFSTFLRLQRHTGKSFVILPQIPEALFREGIFFFSSLLFRIW